MSLPWQGDDEPVDYDCIWRFVDQSPAFVYGVEAGAIYQEMRDGATQITATTHADNEEEIRNLANSMGYSVSIEELDETFQNVTFTKHGATPEEVSVANNAHVYHEHNTTGLDCWCKPTFGLPCDECGEYRPLTDAMDRQDVGRAHADSGDVEAADVRGCWKCKNGLIHLTREQAEREERPLVIVHNDL
jgi:hypothetical protein